jgi:hypothetical protein
MIFKRIFFRLCMPLISFVGLAMCLQVGCSFDAGGIAGPTPDADPTPDVLPDDPCLEWMPVPAHFVPCNIVLPAEPEGDLTLTANGTYTYETDFGTLRDPQNALIAHARQELMDRDPVVRLVSVDSFTLGPNSTLRAIGTKPLLIASWSTITVDGTIDVSTNLQYGPGAGSNTGICNAATAGTDAAEGGGGGGGGGFGDDGGDGGDGGDGKGAKGAKGAKLGAPPANVRGGCPGAKGGKGDRGDGGGEGGKGGGALQLTARQSITVNGKLHAGGQGGRPANGDIGGNDLSRRSAGGGGGSGGMLGLEAPMITVGANAILATNGGGGGGGCDNNLAAGGDDGKLDDTGAKFGDKEGKGGNGGNGGFVSVPPGQLGDSAEKGGGGGGGAVGYIIMSTTPAITGTSKISPAYVTP